MAVRCLLMPLDGPLEMNIRHHCYEYTTPPLLEPQYCLDSKGKVVVENPKSIEMVSNPEEECLSEF